MRLAYEMMKSDMANDKKFVPGQDCTKDDVRRAIAESLAELDAGNYRDGSAVLRELRDKLLDRISPEDDHSDEAA